MKTYNLTRKHYSDRMFYDLIEMQEINNLPSEYCDIFDRDGEIKEKYQHTFNVDSYELVHENVRITDWETLEKFLLEDALTPTELDEDIKEFIANFNWENTKFQVAGDGDGIGFIVDVWTDPEDDQPTNSAQYHFDDYDMGS